MLLFVHIILFFLTISLVGSSKEKSTPFWAFVAPSKPKVPNIQNTKWTINPIDNFILDKIKKAGHEHSERAEPRKLVRRAYLDLLGIPPTTEQLNSYLENKNPNTWSELIEQLLASPLYGERWGRHWLDVARYSDSNGMDENIAHPEAYRYRNYVINAFNQDKPFNQFIIEQIAGDLLPAENSDKKREQTIAAGFLSVGPKMLACDDPDKMRRDIADEQIDTTGRAFMGMTFGCARCHDHKFDPISIEDYYGLAGIFMSTKTLIKYSVVAQLHHHDLSTKEEKERRNKISQLEKKISVKDIQKDTKKKLQEDVATLKKDSPPPYEVLAVTEYPTKDVRVHLRGDYQTLGDTVPRRLPPAIAGQIQHPMPNDQSGRLELARWIASEKNPLTARVIVNRIWRWHFGRGIVPTPDNYGTLGEKPTHPELLDYLTLEFIHSNWSIKSMHRLIMNSATYQQSSFTDKSIKNADPDNELFARWKIRRLESEALRDSILFKANLINFNIGKSMLTAAKNKYANRDKLSEHIKSNKRTVYLPVMRSSGYDGQNAFDFPDPAMINGNRKSSTIAPQALYLMNSPLIHRCSNALAEIHKKATSNTPISNRINWMILHLLSRPATKNETLRVENFIHTYSPGNEQTAWAAFARTLFASNEFLYIE